MGEESDGFPCAHSSHQTISFHAINRASKKASRITQPPLNPSTIIRSHQHLLFYAIFSRRRFSPTDFVYAPVPANHTRILTPVSSPQLFLPAIPRPRNPKSRFNLGPTRSLGLFRGE
ncbi:hypothetical protein F5X98DRAFT_187412 [Xylaria grammica]|nr:hypothetical protein F5X98DRAFT_187412 [Xylaria grammica]